MRCDVCGNRGGPCGTEDSKRKSFYIQFRSNFADHLNVPCFIRKKFNSATKNMLYVEIQGGDLYAFELDKKKNKIRIHGDDSEKFLIDYNMQQDGMIKLYMKDKEHYFNMYPLDKDLNIKERVLEEFVFKNEATAILYPKYFGPTGSEMARMNDAANHGLGAGAVFVHFMTESDIQQNMMHIPKSITSILNIPRSGKARLVMEANEVVKRAECFKSKDGRLRFKKGWTEFAT